MDKLKPVLSQAKDNIHLFGQDTDYGLHKFRFNYPKVGNMEAERKYSSSFFRFLLNQIVREKIV
jgi:hypothetical protein